MKIDFIKKGAETRLILIFAGWSTDARYYHDCLVDGWDTAVVYDYSDMTMPVIPEQYQIIYLFAYSMGVWAASHCAIDASMRVAICGTCAPVSDYLGIPDAVFNATAAGLSQRSLVKFHRRMAGDRQTFDSMVTRLPESIDIEALRAELYFISANSKGEWNAEYRWDRAYIAEEDNIIPTDNQIRFWEEFTDTPTVRLACAHAADIAAIVRQCVPDPLAVGQGFEKALTSYRRNATVQAEVCDRIGDKLRIMYGTGCDHVGSLLEIGVGSGMLTEVWGEIIRPSEATYVDLYEISPQRRAERETYVVADAEKWLEESGSCFDLILSASTIQWFVDPVRFVDTVRKHLNPGGMAVISTFVAGNLEQLDSLRPSPIIYRSADDYRKVDGVMSEEWSRTLRFRSARELLMHLRHTGVTPATGGRLKKAGVTAKAWRLTELPTELTYRPMIIIVNASQ